VERERRRREAKRRGTENRLNPAEAGHIRQRQAWERHDEPMSPEEEERRAQEAEAAERQRTERRESLEVAAKVRHDFTRELGAFLADPTEVPPEVAEYVAAQLGVTDPACLKLYGQRMVCRCSLERKSSACPYRHARYPVREEDVVRLSPLGFKHLNFLGRYAFTAPTPGQLRPLRDPSAIEDEEEDDE
jgi:hypothetical protein